MYAIHPGEILREEYMAPLGLDTHNVAQALGISFYTLEGIIQEQRPITTDIALRLARYFGTDMDMWVKLQAKYEAFLLTTQNAAEFERIVPLVS